MPDYYDQIDFRAPLALRKLLVEFSLHCLYYRPDNLYQFAAYYFQRQVELRQARETSGKHDSGNPTGIKSPFVDNDISTTTSDSHHNQPAVNIDKPIWRQGSADDANGGQDDNLMWIFHCFVHKDSKQAFYDFMYDSIFNHEFTKAHSMNGFVSPKMKGAPFNRSTRAIYHGCFPIPTNIHGLTPVERNEQDDSGSFSVDLDFRNLQHRNRIIDNCTNSNSTDEMAEEVIISNSIDKPLMETCPVHSERNGKEKASPNKRNDEAMIDQDQQATTKYQSVMNHIPKKNPVQSFDKISNQDRIEIMVENNQNNSQNDTQSHDNNSNQDHIEIKAENDQNNSQNDTQSHDNNSNQDRIEIKAENDQNNSQNDTQSHDNSSINGNLDASNGQHNMGHSQKAVKVDMTNSIQLTDAHECINGTRSKINDAGNGQDLSKTTVTDRIPSVINKGKVSTSSSIRKKDESLAVKDDLPIKSDSKIPDKDVVMIELNNTTNVEINVQRKQSHFNQSQKRTKNHSQSGNSSRDNDHSRQNFSKSSHASDKTVKQDKKKVKISRSVVRQSDSKDLVEGKEGVRTKPASIFGQKDRQNHSSQVAYSKLSKTNTDQAMRNTALHGNTKRISHDRRKDVKDKGSIKHLTKKDDQDKNQEKKSTGILQPTHKEKSNSSQNDHPNQHDNLLKQTLNKTQFNNSNPKNPVTSKKLKTKESVNRLDKKDQNKSLGIKSINTPVHTRMDNSSHVPQDNYSSLDKNHLDQTTSKTAGINHKLVRQDESQEVDTNKSVNCLDRKDRNKILRKNPSNISEHACKDNVNLSYSMNPIPDQNLSDQTIQSTGKTSQESIKQADTNRSMNHLDKIDQDQSHGIKSIDIPQQTCKDDGNLSKNRESTNNSEATDPVQDKKKIDQNLSQIIQVESKIENRDKSKEIVTNQSSVKRMNFSNQDKSEDRTILATTTILSKTDKESNHFSRADSGTNKINADNTTDVSNEIDKQDTSKQASLCHRITKSQDQVEERPEIKSSTILSQTGKISKDGSQIVDLAMDKKTTDQNSSMIINLDSKMENRDSDKEMMINKSVTSPSSQLDKRIQKVDEEETKAIFSAIVTMTDKQDSNDSDGVKAVMDKNDLGQVDSSQEMIIKSVGCPISDLDKKIQDEGEEKATAVSSTILSMACENNIASNTVNLEMDKKNSGHIDCKMENLNSSKGIINHSVASLVSALDQNIQDEERTKSIHKVTGEKNNIHSHKIESAIEKNGPGYVDSKIENLDSNKEIVINKSVVDSISELDKKIQKIKEEKWKVISSALVNVSDKQINTSSHKGNPMIEKNNLDCADSKIENLDNSKEMTSTSVTLVNPISEQNKKKQKENEEKIKAKSFINFGITIEQDNNDSSTVNPTMDKGSLGQTLRERSYIDKIIENRDMNKEQKIKHFFSMFITQPGKKMQEGSIESTKAISSTKLRMTDQKNSRHSQGINSTLKNSDPSHIGSKTENQQHSKELKINQSAVTQLDDKNQQESQDGTKAKGSAFQWHKIYASLMKQKQANSSLESSSTTSTKDPSMLGHTIIAKDENRDNSFGGTKKDPITSKHTDLKKEGKKGISLLDHGIQQIRQINSKGLIGHSDSKGWIGHNHTDDTTKKAPAAKENQMLSLNYPSKNTYVSNEITNILYLPSNSKMEKGRKIENSSHISREDEVEMSQEGKMAGKIIGGKLYIEPIPNLSEGQTKIASDNDTSLSMGLQVVSPSSQNDSDLNSNNSLENDDNQKKVISENDYTLEAGKSSGCLSNADDLQDDSIKKEMTQRDSKLKSDLFSYVKNSLNINENRNSIESGNNENINGKLQVVVLSNSLSSVCDDNDNPIQIEKTSQENDDEESCDIAIGKHMHYKESDVIHDRQNSMLKTARKNSIHKDDKDEDSNKAAIRRTKEGEDNNHDDRHTTDELRMHTSKPDLLSYPTSQMSLTKSDTNSNSTISRHDIRAAILERINKLGKSSKKYHNNRKDLSAANDTTNDDLANKSKPKLFKKRLPQPPHSSSQQGHDSLGPATNMSGKLSEMSWQPLALPTHHPNRSKDGKILKKESQENIDIEKIYQGVIPVKNSHHPMARNYRSKSDAWVHGNIIPLMSKNMSQPATSEIVEEVPSRSQMLRYIKEKLTKVEDSANVDHPIAGNLDVAKNGTSKQNSSNDEKDEMHQITMSFSPNNKYSHEFNKHIHDRTIAAYDLAVMDGRHSLASPSSWQHLQFSSKPQVHQKFEGVDALHNQPELKKNLTSDGRYHPDSLADQHLIQSSSRYQTSQKLTSTTKENQQQEPEITDAISNQSGHKRMAANMRTAKLASTSLQVENKQVSTANVISKEILHENNMKSQNIRDDENDQVLQVSSTSEADSVHTANLMSSINSDRRDKNASSIVNHDDYGIISDSGNQPLIVAAKQEINNNTDVFENGKSAYEDETSSKLESSGQHSRSPPSKYDNMENFYHQSQAQIEIEEFSSVKEIKNSKANQDLNIEKSADTCNYNTKSTYSDCNGSDVRFSPCKKERINISNSNLDFTAKNCSSNDSTRQSISSQGSIMNDSNDQQISTPISSKLVLPNVHVNQSENIYHSEINSLDRKKNSTNDGVFSKVDDVSKIQMQDLSNSHDRLKENNNDICISNDDTGKLQSPGQEIGDHCSLVKSQFMNDKSDQVEGDSAKNKEKKRHHRTGKRKGDKKHKKHRKTKASHSRSKRFNTLDSIMEEEEEGNTEQEVQSIHYHVEPNHEIAKLIGKLICNQEIDEDSDTDQDIETIIYDEEIFYPLITTLVDKYEDIIENKLDHLSEQDQEIVKEQYQSLKDISTAADKCWSAYHNGNDFEVLENIRLLKSSLIELIEENHIHEAGLTILANAIGESRVPKTCTIL